MTTTATRPSLPPMRRGQDLAEPLAPWNRPTRAARWWSMGVPLLLVLVGNGLLFATGTAGADPAFSSLRLAPPGWFVGLMWALIFPMWGYARWRVWQAGAVGRRAARWVAALMAWGLAYPVLTLGFETGLSAVANIASLALVLLTTRRVQRASAPAARWLVPSIVWIGFATVLGLAAWWH